eukprot:scaffold4855_cov195-Amphora_coffeaeformis.AAC.8
MADKRPLWGNVVGKEKAAEEQRGNDAPSRKRRMQMSRSYCSCEQDENDDFADHQKPHPSAKNISARQVSQDSARDNDEDDQDCPAATSLEALVRQKFGGRGLALVEHLHDQIIQTQQQQRQAPSSNNNFDVQAFAEKHQLMATDDYELVKGIAALLQRKSPLKHDVPTMWKDMVDVFLGWSSVATSISRRSSSSTSTSSRQTKKRKANVVESKQDRSPKASSVLRCEDEVVEAITTTTQEEEVQEVVDDYSSRDKEQFATVSLRDMNFSEEWADSCLYEMEDPKRRRRSTSRQAQQCAFDTRSSKTKTPQQQGSLEKLVADEYGGNFFRLFEELEQEMRLPTFSFSGFIRRKGVPKARETLRRITYYLNGEPTEHFLAEVWKDRMDDYLISKSRGEQNETSPTNKDQVVCLKSSNDVLRDGVNAPKDVSTTQVTPTLKRGRLRGREGVLDRLVMDKFEGNFFRFLALVEQRMVAPGFTPTGFARTLRVPGGRETLRHIVSHLRGDLLNSDHYLAQMWKDRIRVYLESKEGATVQSGEGSAVLPSSGTVDGSEEHCSQSSSSQNILVPV